MSAIRSNSVLKGIFVSLVCFALIARSDSGDVDSHFPVGNVLVSQWTVDTLFQRFGAALLRDLVVHDVEASLMSWSDVFNVSFMKPCPASGDYNTFLSYLGHAERPLVRPAVASAPTAQLLSDGTLGIYVNISGLVSAQTVGWAIEGLCFQYSCNCTDFPVVTLCNDSLVSLEFNIRARVRALLNATAEGDVRLSMVDVDNEIMFNFTNGCEAWNLTRHGLPWFARNFSDMLMGALQDEFVMLIPRLHSTVNATLEAFVNNTLEPAAMTYFPKRYAYGDGTTLSASYHVISTTVNSTANADSGARDDDATVSWNVSASFEGTTTNGSVARYRSQRTPTVLDSKPCKNSAYATCIALSSELLEVIAWQSSLGGVLNTEVNGTFLDAHIVTSIAMDIPHAVVNDPFGPIPPVSSAVDDTLVGSLFSHGAMAPLLLAMHHCEAVMTCNHSNLLLAEGLMDNVTARTQLLVQLDSVATVQNQRRDGKLSVPANVLSLFLWIVDFNHFKGAKFSLAKLSGGLPTSVLTEMLEFALNHSRPFVNSGFRRSRMPLPPVFQLLLFPIAESSGNVPFTSVTSDELVLLSAKPDGELPPSPPPFLAEAVPVVAALNVDQPRNKPVGVGIFPLLDDVAAIAVQQRVSFLGWMCNPMFVDRNTTTSFSGTLNGTLYWKTTAAVVGNLTYVDNDGNAVVAFGMWPTAVDMLCRDAACRDCALKDLPLTTEDGHVSVVVAVPHSTHAVLTITITTPSSPPSFDAATARCFQPAAESAVPLDWLLVGGCSGNSSSDASVRIVAFDPPEISDTMGCIPSPLGNGASFVVFNNSILGPCSACPWNSSAFPLACPDASLVSLADIPHDSGERCVFDHRVAVVRRSAFPVCTMLRKLSPPATGSDRHYYWIPLGFLVALILMLVVYALLIRNGMCVCQVCYSEETADGPDVTKDVFNVNGDGDSSQRVEREDSLGTNNSIDGTVVAQSPNETHTERKDAINVNGGGDGSQEDSLSEGTNNSTAQYLVAISGLGVVILLLAVVALFSDDPFSQVAEAHVFFGFTQSVDIGPLRAHLNAWVKTVAALLAAVLLAIVVATALVWKKGFPKRQTLLLVTSVVVLAFQVAWSVPPMTLHVLDIANVTLKLNVTTTMVSVDTLHLYANRSASIAAVMYTIPVVVQLANHMVVVLPLGVLLACTFAYLTNNCTPLVSQWQTISCLTAASAFTISTVLSSTAFQSTRSVSTLCLSFLRCVNTLTPMPLVTKLCAKADEDGNGLHYPLTLSVAGCFAVDIVLSIAIAGTANDIVPWFPAIGLHCASLAIYTCFFSAVDFGSPNKGTGRGCWWWVSKKCMTAENCTKCCGSYFSRPWYRLPVLFCAGVCLLVTFALNCRDAKNSNLQQTFISFLEAHGFSYPLNDTNKHIFITDASDAYKQALLSDLWPQGIAVVLILVALLQCVLHAFSKCLAARDTNLLSSVLQVACRPSLSRGLTILSYLFVLGAANYFALPNFVAESNITNGTVPDCGKEFEAQGTLALTSMVQLFFSAVVFGRLLPLLIAFPPAMVRVVWLSRDEAADHFMPMFVGTIVTFASVQLPLLLIVWMSDAFGGSNVMYVAIGFPFCLLIDVFIMHPTVLGGDQRVTSIMHTVWSWSWIFVYVALWCLAITEFILTNPTLWDLLQQMFASESFWFELLSTIFLSTAAFDDLLFLVSQSSSDSHIDPVGVARSDENEPLLRRR